MLAQAAEALSSIALNQEKYAYGLWSESVIRHLKKYTLSPNIIMFRYTV